MLRLFNLETVQKLSQNTGPIEERVDDIYTYAVEQREMLQKSLRILPDG